MQVNVEIKEPVNTFLPVFKRIIFRKAQGK